MLPLMRTPKNRGDMQKRGEKHSEMSPFSCEGVGDVQVEVI